MYADEDILYFNKDSGIVVFPCDEVGILKIDLHNINIDHISYEEDHPDTIILVRILAWYIKFEKRKVQKNNQ